MSKRKAGFRRPRGAAREKRGSAPNGAHPADPTGWGFCPRSAGHGLSAAYPCAISVPTSPPAVARYHQNRMATGDGGGLKPGAPTHMHDTQDPAPRNPVPGKEAWPAFYDRPAISDKARAVLGELYLPISPANSPSPSRRTPRTIGYCERTIALGCGCGHHGSSASSGYPSNKREKVRCPGLERAIVFLDEWVRA